VGAIEYFRYLKFGLSIVLVFIGAKMLTERWIEIPTPVSLAIVAGIILISIAASMILARWRPPLDPPST